jgi:hypothetical protein
MSDWFENKLDDQLGNYDSPLDLNQTWEELEVRRNRRRRLPIWLWWSAGASVLVLAILFSLSLDSPTSHSLGYFFSLEESSSIPKENLPEAVSTGAMVPEEESKTEVKHFTRSVSKLVSIPTEEPTTEEGAILPVSNTLSKTSSIAFLPTENQLLIAEKPALSLRLSNNNHRGQTSSSSSWELHSWGAYGIANWPESPGPLDLEPVDGWKTFLGVRKQVFNRWNISTGIQFEQYFTRLTYAAAVIYEEVRPGQVVEVYLYQDGTEEEVISDAPVMVEEEIEFDAWQRHRFLSVPVLLGYSQPLGSRSALSIQAGPSISLWADHQGSYLQPSATGAKVADIQGLDYRTSGIWSGMVLLQYEQQLGRRWQLNVHIQGANQLTANRNDRDVYPEKFSFLGGGLGLSYRLN